MNFKKNTELTDLEIIAKIIKSKDTHLFEVLYNRYAKKVYQKCISVIKEQAISADLTQDIFMKVYMNLVNFKNQSTFSTWVYSITYNECIDYIRKSKKFQHFTEISDATDFSVYESASHETSDEEIFSIEPEVLREILDRISIHDKMILLMKYQDNFSIKDIQKSFDLASESAVKMRLKRAKEKVLYAYDEYIAEKQPVAKPVEPISIPTSLSLGFIKA